MNGDDPLISRIVRSDERLAAAHAVQAPPKPSRWRWAVRAAWGALAAAGVFLGVWGAAWLVDFVCWAVDWNPVWHG